MHAWGSGPLQSLLFKDETSYLRAWALLSQVAERETTEKKIQLLQGKFSLKGNRTWKIAGGIKYHLCHKVFSGAISSWGLSGKVLHAAINTFAKQYRLSVYHKVAANIMYYFSSLQSFLVPLPFLLTLAFLGVAFFKSSTL